ncbi:hypothetical protein BSYN_14730 [Bacteroides sedimenti]|uniref:Transposase n=1 Tax=Bacteroides sedimenti TaxID=2136147 RepID=A0ABM8IGU1_9BACE
MKKSKHSENEILKTVNQFDRVLSADVICREYGISHTTRKKSIQDYGKKEKMS